MTRSYLPADFADHATRAPSWSGLSDPAVAEAESPATFMEQIDCVWEEVPLALADTGESIPTHKAIVAVPRSNPAARRPIAVTSVDYHLVTGEHDGTICTRIIGKPPIAGGIMGRGIGIWMLFPLGKMNVRGDEVDMNLLYVSPKNGQGAVMIRLQPLRIICSNAITMSGRTAVETYKAVHDAHVLERTTQWLDHVMAQIPLRQRVLEQDFAALSDTRVPDDLARKILQSIYADPPKPVNDAPEELMRERRQNWEERRQRITQRRSVALDLYQGQGTGMGIVACKGTAWGLLAAVTEIEDWSRSHTAATRAESAMFGQRAAVKSRAFDILLGLANSL